MFDYKDIAFKMLNIDLRNKYQTLPICLAAALDRASRRLEMVGGELRSRQIVATIVDQWEMNR